MERGELPVNHYAEFKINSSLFTPTIPKEPEYEVYNEAEEKLIKEMAYKEFEKHPDRTSSLSVVINFSLRVKSR